jgi:hypothetical protein
MSASADPHYTIIDADVGWFRRHPRRRHRVRPSSQAVEQPLPRALYYAAVRRVGDRAHQKIVIALPAKPTVGELSEEQAAAVWQYWFSLVSPTSPPPGARAKDGDTHPVLCPVCYRLVTRSRIRC